MGVNDEFSMGDDEFLTNLGNLAAEEYKTNAKKKMKKVQEEEVVEAPKKNPPVVADVKLTAKQPVTPTKKPLIKIMIDEVKGMSNFETVSPNGVVYKIKRGVVVEVPQEVVNALELCVMTHIEERKNPYTGEREESVKKYSAIPWRKM